MRHSTIQHATYRASFRLGIIPIVLVLLVAIVSVFLPTPFVSPGDPIVAFKCIQIFVTIVVPLVLSFLTHAVFRSFIGSNVVFAGFAGVLLLVEIAAMAPRAERTSNREFFQLAREAAEERRIQADELRKKGYVQPDGEYFARLADKLRAIASRSKEKDKAIFESIAATCDTLTPAMRAYATKINAMLELGAFDLTMNPTVAILKDQIRGLDVGTRAAYDLDRALRGFRDSLLTELGKRGVSERRAESITNDITAGMRLNEQLELIALDMDAFRVCKDMLSFLKERNDVWGFDPTTQEIKFRLQSDLDTFSGYQKSIEDIGNRSSTLALRILEGR